MKVMKVIPLELFSEFQQFLQSKDKHNKIPVKENKKTDYHCDSNLFEKWIFFEDIVNNGRVRKT